MFFELPATHCQSLALQQLKFESMFLVFQSTLLSLPVHYAKHQICWKIMIHDDDNDDDNDDESKFFNKFDSLQNELVDDEVLIEEL